MIATITHARVRAAQGDVAGALAVLKSLLAASPGDAEAVRLHDQLARSARRSTAALLRTWIGGVRARRGVRP
jgi:uncharacterized protein HemY